VRYNDTANNLIVGDPNLTLVGFSEDWSTWWLGSRTQWNVTKDFYLGFDVLYAKLQTARVFSGSLGAAAAPQPLATSTTGNSASAYTATSIPDRVAAI
jgi:hypothetical protein